jgi:hypothetical protein
VGRIVTFDDSKPTAKSRGLQISILLWGFRFMDSEYEDKTSGATHNAKSYIAYVGCGTARRPVGRRIAVTLCLRAQRPQGKMPAEDSGSQDTRPEPSEGVTP